MAAELAECAALAKHHACTFARNAYLDGTMTSTSPLTSDRIAALPMPPVAHARFTIGDVVRHRLFEFRGVVFDIDPVFANTEEWYQSIPEEVRPPKEQPFYHLLAENAESSYIAYVSQQNLMTDDSDEPVHHPAIPGLFEDYRDGRYALRREHRH
jgi:heat shock protein HspQ